MRRLTLILLPTILLAASCGEEDPEYVGSPAVEITLKEASHTTATFEIKSINTDAVRLLCVKGSELPAAETVVAEGTAVHPGTVVVEDLSPGAEYLACAVGVRGEELSKVQKVPFSTLIGRLPEFADITLCTGGGRPNSNSWFSVPAKWTAGRFAPHVSYSDESGEHWLFDAFLAITGIDMEGRTYCINNNGSLSADKASWEALASYWLDPGGAFSELEKQVAAVASRIGEPKRRRQVVMMMPDPIMFSRFSDKSSSTSYWGALNGRQLDFSAIDDQIAACKWYIDLCREKFAALAPAHLSLAGFYIISEELVAEPTGWNYNQKRWDRILPKLSDHIHAKDQALYWIPYLGADGCTLWRQLGIDVAWLQPNYYWDRYNEKPIATAFAKMKQYGMGMELEFEYSRVAEVMAIPGIMGPDGQGRYVFTADDVASLRGRFREYMDGYKEAGLYGKAPVALYSGSNALYQLGTSSDPSDRALYLDLCRFITGSSLKK